MYNTYLTHRCRYAPHWGKVQPFLPAPLPNPLSGPPLDKYLEDFKEVKSIGTVSLAGFSVHPKYIL